MYNYSFYDVYFYEFLIFDFHFYYNQKNIKLMSKKYISQQCIIIIFVMYTSMNF